MVQEFGDAGAGLAGNPQDVVRRAAENVGDLRGVPLRVGSRQIDLVQHRDDRQIVLERQIQIGQRLRFDALGGVDQQDGALTGSERTRHLVGEVDMSGRVDQMQDVVLARVGTGARNPGKSHILRLDGDAALALDVHPIEVLRPHGPTVDDTRQLQHAIGERRLPVVDVRDDAEVANPLRWGEGAVRVTGEVSGGHGLLSAPKRAGSGSDRSWWEPARMVC